MTNDPLIKQTKRQCKYFYRSSDKTWKINREWNINSDASNTSSRQLEAWNFISQSVNKMKREAFDSGERKADRPWLSSSFAANEFINGILRFIFGIMEF